jgi:hypothetical protein
VTCRETEGSTGEDCGREDTSRRAGSDAEDCSDQATGKQTKDIEEHRFILQNFQERGVTIYPDLGLDQTENTQRQGAPQQCEGQMLRCSGEMKKLLISRANSYALSAGP